MDLVRRGARVAHGHSLVQPGVGPKCLAPFAHETVEKRPPVVRVLRPARHLAGSSFSRCVMSIIELKDVHRTYGEGHAAVHALRGVSLSIPPGQFVAIMGPSGSGTSTLLHLLGALDWPSRGEVILDNNAVARMDDNALTRLRRERIGFIFQFFNLLPTLSAVENVCLPALLAGKSLSSVEGKAKELLASSSARAYPNVSPDKRLFRGRSVPAANSRPVLPAPQCRPRR